MGKKADSTWNLFAYSCKEAAYNAALPMINGALIQLFLSNRGVAASQIGLFNSVIYIITLGTMLVLSTMGEKKANPLAQSTKMLLVQALLYLLYLPVMAMKLDSGSLLLFMMAAAGIQTALYSGKVVLEYKLQYQIVFPKQYGSLVSTSGIAIGLVGIAVSFLCSAMIEANAAGNPYLVCMLVTFGLLALTFWFSKKLRIVNHALDIPSGEPVTLKKISGILHEPVFKKFIIPNTLRGITIGVTNSIAIIALAMGVDEASASMLPAMYSIGFVAASMLYYFLPKLISGPVVGLCGSCLLCAIVFLPENNANLFLFLAFIAYMGRVLVDHAIPDILFQIINPEIAGVYNAWRNILGNVSTTVAVYLVGVLAEKANMLFLLIPCVAAYMISMTWYYILYKKLYEGR